MSATQATGADAIVRIRGGLGNQLFQYAFGQLLELKYNRRVVFDLSFYNQRRRHHETPKLLEYGFPMATTDTVPAEAQRARKFKRLSYGIQLGLFGIAYVKDKEAGYSPIPGFSGATYFDGLWQSPLYFKGYEEEIRNRVRRPLLLCADLRASIKVNTIGCHIRRGDYLGHNTLAKLDYRTYIENAITSITDATGKSVERVELFSDDPDWCEQNLADGQLVRVFRGATVLDDFVGLMLCQHKVISNSTFSWWAAYIDHATDGLVVAPKRWFNDRGSREIDIVVDPSWIVVPDCSSTRSCSPRPRDL